MDYLDFQLRIDAGQEDRYPVAVLASPSGEASDVVPVPLGNPAFWARFDNLADMRSGGRTLSSQDEAQLVQDAGRFLFDLIFTGAIRDAYRSSLALARREEKGLRIRLRIEAPALAALPWELLHDDAPLCLSIETPSPATWNSAAPAPH